ncbi:MAG: hypothetical protein HY508_10135 [Acidobacteria bacterium]|nr:hypothetical protein [Acidobacteriota bacterium]
MHSENFLLVALAAEKFACRPSQMVGLEDSVLALDFDLAAAARLIERERAALSEIRSGPAEGDREVGRQTREERW